MDLGLAHFLTDWSMGPAELGRQVEERGFESLFLPEHTHLPVHGASVHPSGPGVHDRLRRFLDPLIALTAVAAVTERLRLGTGVCLVPQHDPIALAKQIATLDLLSNGRFLFGVGAGWNREEMRNHGTDPRTRFSLLRERVEAMKAIWTEDEAEYHGKHVDFDPIWSWPKPVQRPHPPIVVGGNAPKVLERVVRFGDGWMPNRVGDVDDLRQRVDELQRLASEAGRERIPVTLYGGSKDPEVVKRYPDAGVDRCVFWLPSATGDELERKLEDSTRAAGLG